MTSATEKDDGKCQRAPKCLCGRREVSLVLDSREGKAMEVFVNASHAVHDDAKGHSGAIARMCNVSDHGGTGILSWCG